jgi:hypothetical protein
LLFGFWLCFVREARGRQYIIAAIIVQEAEGSPRGMNIGPGARTGSTGLLQPAVARNVKAWGKAPWRVHAPSCQDAIYSLKSWVMEIKRPDVARRAF